MQVTKTVRRYMERWDAVRAMGLCPFCIKEIKKGDSVILQSAKKFYGGNATAHAECYDKHQARTAKDRGKDATQQSKPETVVLDADIDNAVAKWKAALYARSDAERAERNAFEEWQELARLRAKQKKGRNR